MHLMTPSNETFFALLALCAGNSQVTGEFPSQRPVKRRFDVFFYLCLNKRFSKQAWGCWFETPSRWLWRLCNANGEQWVWRHTHWGQVTHICVSKLTIIDSDNCMSPGRPLAIIWTTEILSIVPLGTNFSESAIRTFPFKKMHLNMSSGKWRPFGLGLSVLRGITIHKIVLIFRQKLLWRFAFRWDIVLVRYRSVSCITNRIISLTLGESNHLISATKQSTRKQWAQLWGCVLYQTAEATFGYWNSLLIY